MNIYAQYSLIPCSLYELTNILVVQFLFFHFFFFYLQNKIHCNMKISSCHIKLTEIKLKAI